MCSKNLEAKEEALAILRAADSPGLKTLRPPSNWQQACSKNDLSSRSALGQYPSSLSTMFSSGSPLRNLLSCSINKRIELSSQSGVWSAQCGDSKTFSSLKKG